MRLKVRQARYKRPKNIFISNFKAKFWIKHNLAFIYDTRPKKEFNKSHLQGAIRISALVLRSRLLNQNIDDKIIIIGPHLRTHAADVSWAKYRGIKNIHLLKTSITDRSFRKFVTSKN